MSLYNVSIESHPINYDWMRVAEGFSYSDLQPNPNTTRVMAYFSDDATFSETNKYNVGKTVAWIGYKVLCEWSVLEFQKDPEVKLEEKDDHIIWSFKSIQLRKGLLPTWIKAPQWYRIDYSAKLYFTGSGDKTLISHLETTKNEWEIIPS